MFSATVHPVPGAIAIAIERHTPSGHMATVYETVPDPVSARTEVYAWAHGYIMHLLDDYVELCSPCEHSTFPQFVAGVADLADFPRNTHRDVIERLRRRMSVLGPAYRPADPVRAAKAEAVVQEILQFMTNCYTLTYSDNTPL